MREHARDPGTLNLWDVTDKLNSVEDIVLSTSFNGKKVDLVGGKIITVILSVNGAVSSEKQFSDFYVVRQDLMLTPADMISNDWDDRGWYVDKYVITTEVVDQRADNIDLIQGSPQSAVGQTSVSSSTSLSLGASAGTFGLTPTTGVNAGYSVSDSTSFTIADVEVKDRCHKTKKNVAQWVFEMPKVSLIKDMTDFHLSDPKNLSTNTFQPKVYGIWRIKKRHNDKFRIKTTVEAMLTRTTIDRGDSDAVRKVGSIARWLPGIGGFVSDTLNTGNRIAYAVGAKAAHSGVTAATSFFTEVDCPPIALLD